MGIYKSPTNKYCILRDSESLRIAIRQVSKRFNMSEVCKEVGVGRIKYYEWLNGSKPKGLSQFKIIRICKKLGIVIDLKITLTTSE